MFSTEIVYEFDGSSTSVKNEVFRQLVTPKTYVATSENWEGEPIIVNWTFIDEAPAPTLPDQGTYVDEEGGNKFTIHPATGVCPEGLDISSDDIGIWFSNPKSIFPKAIPDLGNDNNPDYVGMFIREEFGPVIPLFELPGGC